MNTLLRLVGFADRFDVDIVELARFVRDHRSDSTEDERPPVE
jgi:hypothetical protein